MGIFAELGNFCNFFTPENVLLLLLLLLSLLLLLLLFIGVADNLALSRHACSPFQIPRSQRPVGNGLSSGPRQIRSASNGLRLPRRVSTVWDI